MKVAVCIFALLLMADTLVFSQNPSEDQPKDNGACGFTVQGEPAVATITGPDDIVPLVYVVEQPDSPIEILSIDLDGTWLSISHEEQTHRSCAKYKVRNRSDRVIQKFEVQMLFQGAQGGGGAGSRSTSALGPGQIRELTSCNGGGRGSAPGDHLRLIVSVRAVNFGNCLYQPSTRIPKSLGVYSEL